MPNYVIFKDNILSHTLPINCSQSCHRTESKVAITDSFTAAKLQVPIEQKVSMLRLSVVIGGF